MVVVVVGVVEVVVVLVVVVVVLVDEVGVVLDVEVGVVLDVDDVDEVLEEVELLVAGPLANAIVPARYRLDPDTNSVGAVSLAGVACSTVASVQSYACATVVHPGPALIF